MTEQKNTDTTGKDQMQLMLYPINVNDNLVIEDYDHLHKEAVDIKNEYEGFIGTSKQCRHLKTRVNRLKRGLNDVRKAKARPHRKRLKGFKYNIDSLIGVLNVITDNMDKQLKTYDKARRKKLVKKLQPDMDEICVNDGIEPFPVPEEAIEKKSMSRKKRLDLMMGTAKKKAEKIMLKNARLFHGKPVDISANGEIEPLKNVAVRKMTFIGSKYQLHLLNQFIKKQGINVKEDE